MNVVVLLGIVATVGGGLIAVLLGRRAVRVSGCQQRRELPRVEHHTGDELINNPLTFRTATARDTLAAKLIADVAPGRQEGSPAELHLALAEPTGDGVSFVLLYCVGGARKIMETAVLLRSSGSGTVGSVGLEAWQTVDGVIDTTAVRTARSVREGVRRVVAQLDSAAEFNEVA